MRKITKRILFISIPMVCLIIGIAGYYYVKRSGPSSLPDITLETLDGNTMTLQSLRGKPALIVFWASTCAICLKEMPRLINLYHTYAPQGLEVIGIVIYYNNPTEAAAMVEERQIPYRILLDRNKQATHAFGNVHFTPSTFLISPSGKIVYRQTGLTNFDAIEQSIKNYLGTEKD